MTFLRNLAASVTFLALVAGPANAASIIFSENFDSDPGNTVGDVGPGDTIFSDSALGFYTSASATTDTGALALPSFMRGSSGNTQNRTSGILVSLDGVDAGSYDLEYDIDSFAPGVSTVSLARVYQISGLGDSMSANSITIDFGNNSTSQDVDITVPGGSTAAFTDLTPAGVPITGDGADQGTSFSLASAGTASDFLFVAFVRTNTGSGSSSAAFNVDNISIETAVPEPASLALLGLGIAGAFVRRRK